jgi:hypothetical protein
MRSHYILTSFLCLCKHFGTTDFDQISFKNHIFIESKQKIFDRHFNLTWQAIHGFHLLAAILSQYFDLVETNP